MLYLLKKLKCALCKDKLVVEKVMDTDTSHRLIRNLDRGGLLYPQTEVVNAVLYNYIIVKKLISKDYEKCFSNVTSQRLVAINLTVNVLSERECFSTWDDSEIHHSSEEVIKMVIWASTNTLLNNYCKLKNDLCCSNRKTSKKRKLATVMNS